ncbi:MAG: hypothetical protein VX223_01160 [Myxococcota bacterium]|nr:hypothetical protein [Myxococcota bacterium]
MLSRFTFMLKLLSKRRPVQGVSARRLSRSTVALLAIVGLGLTQTACDGTARIFLRLLSVDTPQVIGLTPVKLVNGANGPQWVPACSGDETNYRLDFNILTTQRQPDSSGNIDSNQQARPNDAVSKTQVRLGTNLSANNFEVELTCLEPTDGTQAGGDCANPGSQSVGLPDETPLQFIDHISQSVCTPDNCDVGSRDTGVGVAFVIDQSGSTSGLVDGSAPEGTPTCLEGQPGSFDSLAGSLAPCTSDSRGYRLTFVQKLLQNLNRQDSVVVYAASEAEDVKIACNLPGQVDQNGQPLLWNELAESLKETNCYSTDKRLYTSTGAADIGVADPLLGTGGLLGQGEGRSNIFAGVQKSFEFLQTKPQSAKHIIVVTDGPDTCNAESDAFQYCFDAAGVGPKPQTPCPTQVSYSNLRTAIENYTSGGQQDIHITFVQFQSQAYKAPDPRMQQLSCLTGGHYYFVNSQRVQDGVPSAMFDKIRTKLRTSLTGYWGLVLNVPGLTDTSTAASAKVGSSYALRGLFRMTQTPFTAGDYSVSFGFGPANQDERLQFTRRCTSDADCNGTGEECTLRCDPERGVCATPPSGRTCSGNTGICCQGACDTSGVTTCEDPNDPLVCP